MPYELTSLSDLSIPPEHIMRLLRSGLGLNQILERCPEVTAEEVQRVMQYTAGMAFWQLRTIQPGPVPPPSADPDDDEIEALRKRIKELKAKAEASAKPAPARGPAPRK